MSYLLNKAAARAGYPAGLWYAPQPAIKRLERERPPLKRLALIAGDVLTLLAVGPFIVFCITQSIREMALSGVSAVTLVGLAGYLYLQSNRAVRKTAGEILAHALEHGGAVPLDSYLYVTLVAQLQEHGQDLQKLDDEHGSLVSPLVKIYLRCTMPLLAIRDDPTQGVLESLQADDQITTYAQMTAKLISMLVDLSVNGTRPTIV